MPDPPALTTSPSAARAAPAPAFPIVGIGTSAGGLEAAIKLFAPLPTDIGMAFVLVQHLDPDHASQLTTLLARATALPNQIYVMPPHADLTIAHGILYLRHRAEHPAIHLPIDTFLQALTTDQGAWAVWIIPPRTGPGGTHGLRAIKEVRRYAYRI